MPIRMLPGRAWALAAVLLCLPGQSLRAQDPALAQLKQANELSDQADKRFAAKSYTEGNQVKAKGIEAYQKAIQLNPSLVEAHRRLGDLYRKNTGLPSNFQHAIDAYKKALELNPNDAETVSRLGISYSALGRLPEAIPAFEQAVRLDPRVAMYQYNLGFTHAELMSLDDARKSLARLQPMDSALARKLNDKIAKLSGESSLIGRPKTYDNPKIELVSIPPGGKVKSRLHVAKYPVTQAQWQAVMGDNPSFFNTCGGNCPVEQVSWNDALAFITRLNLMKDGFRYRLPSEAEWEYAYRGGTTGITYADGDIGWHSGNSGSKTHPVGEKPANPFGLYDMGGHVKEWCLDWYTRTGAGADASPVEKGDEPLYRVLRGASFYAMPSPGATLRNKGRIDEVSRNNGVRVVAEQITKGKP